MEQTIELTTTFAGLRLSNPIIAASCSLTGNAEQNKRLAEAGFGAIVLKSLFEEDITRATDALMQSSAHHSEAEYMEAYLASHALSEYLALVKESKALCGATPIIASINCHSEGEWVAYAKAIEQAGADALELNVMRVEGSAVAEDGDVERRYMAITQSVAQSVKIPVVVKLTKMLSNPVSLTARLMSAGATGVVMFNRLYETDIDIDTMSYTRGEVLGTAADFALPLRYIAITSAALPKASLALSGGVQGGECVIKALLAGAQAVEVCSTLYRNGSKLGEWVAEATAKIAAWQEAQGYSSVDEFVGAMNNSSDEYKDEIMRSQFLKHFGQYR